MLAEQQYEYLYTSQRGTRLYGISPTETALMLMQNLANGMIRNGMMAAGQLQTEKPNIGY